MKTNLLPWTYGTRNLLRAPVRLVQNLLGAMLVVLLFLAAMGFIRGMERSLLVVDHGNVLLLGAGSEESLERSEIAVRVAGIAAASIDGIERVAGQPLVSPEVQMAALVRTERDGVEHLALLRGVQAPAFVVHDQVQILDGHPPGPNEMLVGRLAATKLGVSEAELATGQSLWFDDREWRICGHFQAPASVYEAEIWTDLVELQIAAKRDNLSTVVVRLTENAELADVQVFTQSRLDLELVALSEAAYYAALFRFLRPVQWMVWLTACLIVAGAFLGGLNTLHATFSARIRELAALQAMGYGPVAIVVSLLQETLLTVAAGGLAAAAVALVFLDGLAVRFTMGVFGLEIDPTVLVSCLGAGIVLAVAGVLVPAWRALSLPIAEALKSA